MPQIIERSASLCLVASIVAACSPDGLAPPDEADERVDRGALALTSPATSYRGSRPTIYLSPAGSGAPGAPGATADDLAAQAALDTLTGGGTVYFQAGVYTLSRAMQVRSSHVSLVGDSGALIVVAPPSTQLNKEAILVNPAVRIEDIKVRGLSFQVNNGATGSSSQGVVQINRCTDCIVEDVHLFWDPSWPAGAAKPESCDGIVFALGSTGAIRDAVVDGIPKAGIYVVGALRPEDGTTDVRVENCEVMHGTIEGIGVTGWSHAFIEACDVHDNGIGLNIAGGDASNSLRDMSVEVDGGVVSNNGIGVNINIVATATPLPPKNIHFVGSTVTNNAGSGIVIRAVRDLRLESVSVTENGAAGIAIADPRGPEAAVRRVEILDAFVYHNSLAARAPGILLQGSADRITISGGTVADDEPIRTQRVAIQIGPDSTTPPGYSPTNVVISGVDLRADVPILTIPPP